jgi:hypothetical protein
MIFDRTKYDVENAIIIREEKVKKFQELTDDDIIILEKGFLTINTLNRIEEKQKELKNIFEKSFYFVDEIENKKWNYEDIFKKEDWQRILHNCDILKKSYFVYSSTPKIPDEKFTKYQNINDLEKTLYDLNVMIEDVKSNYRECGAFECGGDLI